MVSCLRRLSYDPASIAKELTMTPRFTGSSACCALACLLLTSQVSAADVAAGKAVAQARCAACHAPADWKGETDAGLQSLLRDVVSGRVKHTKARVELSDADIANITAFWLSTKK
jgi:mono/diheme cytochrome c family protein